MLHLRVNSDGAYQHSACSQPYVRVTAKKVGTTTEHRCLVNLDFNLGSATRDT